MNSNIFALILASTIFGFMMFGFSSVVFAESANLLFKIDNPGLTRDLFGSTVNYVDGNIVVGAADKTIDDVAYAGSIYVYDGKSGSLLYTIDNPEPTLGDQFGLYVTTSENNIVVSLPIDNGDNASNGIIYVFDGKTGSLLYTIKNPRGVESGEGFGRHITTIGDNIVTNSILKDSTTGKSTVVIYVFDGKTGSLLHTITNPKSDDGWWFSNNIASVGNNILTGSFDEDPNDDNHTNVMFVFDGTTGSLVRTIENPEPDRGDVFGHTMIGTDDKIIVGVPVWRVDNNFVGAIYVFDAKTGLFLYSIPNPEKDNTGMMGWDIGTFGNNIVASAQILNSDGDQPNNVVYVFDGDTGSHLYTITDPEPNNGDGFGSTITTIGDNIAVSQQNKNSFDPYKNTIYVFGSTNEIAGSLSNYLVTAAIVGGAIILGIFLFRKSRSSKVQNPELTSKI